MNRRSRASAARADAPAGAIKTTARRSAMCIADYGAFEYMSLASKILSGRNSVSASAGQHDVAETMESPAAGVEVTLISRQKRLIAFIETKHWARLPTWRSEAI
jgi:hypothetical protein